MADFPREPKAMGLHKKQREASQGLAFSNTRALADVETREEKGTLKDQVRNRFTNSFAAPWLG